MTRDVDDADVITDSSRVTVDGDEDDTAGSGKPARAIASAPRPQATASAPRTKGTASAR